MATTDAASEAFAGTIPAFRERHFMGIALEIKRIEAFIHKLPTPVVAGYLPGQIHLHGVTLSSRMRTSRGAFAFAAFCPRLILLINCFASSREHQRPRTPR
jgi:hypothetical protein